MFSNAAPGVAYVGICVSLLGSIGSGRAYAQDIYDLTTETTTYGINGALTSSDPLEADFSNLGSPFGPPPGGSSIAAGPAVGGPPPGQWPGTSYCPNCAHAPPAPPAPLKQADPDPNGEQNAHSPENPRTCHPVIIAAGNKTLEEVDFIGSGPEQIKLVRTYSKMLHGSGIFGPNWLSVKGDAHLLLNILL